MESSGYVEQGGRAGEGFRLDAAMVVQRGRWREFRQTILIAVGLFFLQQPFRQVVEGDLPSVYTFPLVVPGRLSLLIDVLFVVAYVFVAYRAFGLIRSCRPEARVLRLNQLGLGLVFVGALLDLWEDWRLWVLLGEGSHGLALSFGEAFGAGAEGTGFTAPDAGLRARSAWCSKRSPSWATGRPAPAVAGRRWRAFPDRASAAR